MISSFRLKFGRAPGVATESIPATSVTIFVGPNNSGKSKVLSEISGFCHSGGKSHADVILDEVAFLGLTREAAVGAINHVTVQPSQCPTA
jgi:ABC-type cobalamin/Fe3+-siderophores transport system ATPase subunit